jgi:hypothetical protein
MRSDRERRDTHEPEQDRRYPLLDFHLNGDGVRVRLSAQAGLPASACSAAARALRITPIHAQRGREMDAPSNASARVTVGADGELWLTVRAG